LGPGRDHVVRLDLGRGYAQEQEREDEDPHGGWRESLGAVPVVGKGEEGGGCSCVRRGTKTMMPGSEHEAQGRPVRVHAEVVCCSGVGVCVYMCNAVPRVAQKGEREGWGKLMCRVRWATACPPCPLPVLCADDREGMAG
jgi:hypothetical protein